MPSTSPNFDRVARIYRWAEYLTLGSLLVRIRLHYLPQLAGRRYAYALGDGDGRFLARLMQQEPTLHATAVDTSSAMLSLLRNRCNRTAPDAHTRLITLHASALEAPPPPATDLIVTHFFLDCLTQPEVDGLAHNLAAKVAPGALWLVSDFAPPRPRLLRPFAALYIRALYLAFRLLTDLRVTRLPDPQTALAGAGFMRIERHERLCGLLYTELWQLPITLATPVKSSKAL